jgi:hypothetical protein
MKSADRSKALVIWGFAVLAVVLAVTFVVLRNRSLTETSKLWTDLDGTLSEPQIPKTIAELEKFAQENQGSIPGRTARFQLARLYLNDGLQELAASRTRPEAADKVEKARNLYQQLAQETSDAPLLVQEALMGQAKAEESLIGVPQKDNPGQPRGTVAKALELYRQLAAAQPGSFLTQAAAKRAEVLQARGEQIERFYVELQESLTKDRTGSGMLPEAP